MGKFNKIECWFKDAYQWDHKIGVVELNSDRILIHDNQTIEEIEKKVREFIKFASIGEIL